MSTPKIRTHEQYVRDVWAVLVRHGNLTDDERDAARSVKLLYSVSQDGLYGITRHGAWQLAKGAKPRRKKAKKGEPACDHPHHHGHGAQLGIVAQGGETACQLATTVAHELGHVVCGPGKGHSAVWRDACTRLGMQNMVAAGAHVTGWEHNFQPDMAKRLAAIPLWNDGNAATLASVVKVIKATLGDTVLPPALQGNAPLPVVKVKPCGAGFGTLGGRSRGKGSGSRQLKHVCKCEPPRIIRAATRDTQATCKVCKADYALVEASLPPAHGMGASGQGVPAKLAKQHGARPPRVKRGAVAKVRAKLAKAAKAREQAKAKAPAPKATPARKRKIRAATEGQAPLPAASEPAPLGTVAGVPVHGKANAAWCETHNGPVTMCGCVL